MALKGKGKRAIQAFVDEAKEFDHGTYSGKIETEDTLKRGMLPIQHYAFLLSQFKLLKFLGGEEKVAILYSYDTPIAFRVGKVWEMLPEQKYSVTTSNHQGVMRTAISNPGFYKNCKW